MRRILAIAMHPYMYYLFRKSQEMMVLLHAACEMLHIRDVTVWDVDRLNGVLNQILEALHEDPHLLDGNNLVMKHLFWTRLFSRFRKLTISREETKKTLDGYRFTIDHIHKENPTSFDVVLSHILMVREFGNLI